MAGSLQTGFELHHDVGRRRGPIYYISLYILVLSSFRASPRLGDAFPGLSKLRDG